MYLLYYYIIQIQNIPQIKKYLTTKYNILNTKNGLYTIYLLNFPLNYKVIVWKENKKTWTELYKLYIFKNKIL